MTRRDPGFIELRWYYMRNSKSDQMRRTAEFVSGAYLPAARRAGIGPVGIFSPVIAVGSPFLLVVSESLSLAQMQASTDRLAADAEYQSALTEFDSHPELPYMRMESTLLRCFESVPGIETGPGIEAQSAATGRRFELRIYESDTSTTLKKKIAMFDEGEVDLFRRNGLQPVFFGEVLVGAKQPCLIYMIAHENMAGREKSWGSFIADPDWKKMITMPGYSDAEIVANSSNMILRAVSGSEIQ